jgi:hypothetical protein
MAKSVFELLKDIITIADRVERLAKEADRMDDRQDQMNERLIRLESQFELALKLGSSKKLT